MIYCDFETFSHIDITQSGAYRYAEDETTVALMLGWAIDDGEINLWDIQSGEPCPVRLHEALFKDKQIISAFNANFERLIFKHTLNWDIPVEQFSCAMVKAYTLGFKGGLDMCLEQFEVGAQKYPRGKQLMKIFSIPSKEAERTPELYEEYKTYCVIDVETERKLSRKLSAYTTLTNKEVTHYNLDQQINDVGIPIDMELVTSALSIAETEKSILAQQLTDLSGMENPNANKQFMQWAKNRFDITLPNMQKATIEKKLAGELPDDLRAAFIWKQQLSKTSTAKWVALNRSTGVDNRVRGAFQFIGASRTGRWAGRLVQFQNLPRGSIANPETACELMKHGHELLSMTYPKVMDVLSSTIRGAIQAPKGTTLVVSDLSSIESRLIGWVTGCNRIIDIFHSGQDTYKDLAARIFDVHYDEVTKHQRFLAKPASLGGQYMLGGKGLRAYAENFGVELTEKESQAHIDTYRGMYPEIPNFWYWLKDAISYVLTTKTDYTGYRLTLAVRGDFLFIKLPSGRNIPYYKPEMQMLPAPWDKSQKIEAFTYMGMGSYPNTWQRISAHAGGVTENIIQAIARDVLVEWMVRVDKVGYKMVGHVHDEVIIECDAHPDHVLEHTNQLIEAPIDWAPGLLLKAEGFIADRYKKG